MGPTKAPPEQGGVFRVDRPRRSAQAAEQPDNQNDRQRNADQPQQKSTSHDAASGVGCFGENALACAKFLTARPQ
jgi:hypothetical protein